MIRGIVARNVLSLRDRRYATLSRPTARNSALAKDAGTVLSTIQRILERRVGTSIDTIEALADVFGVRPQDLLTPYFASAMDAPLPAQAELGEASLHRGSNR